MSDRPLSDEELAKLSDEERKARLLELSQEIAKRYDPGSLAKLVTSSIGRGEKLDDATRRKMEQVLGGSFGEVRILRGPIADAVTKRHRADAITIANTGMILVREGTRRSDLRSPKGQALLAHELTHVRQAQQGMHFAASDGGQQSGKLEHEAHKVEAEFLAGGGPSAADLAKAKEARRLRVMERVFELLEESDWIGSVRLGRR
jgi:hypothetical protein